MMRFVVVAMLCSVSLILLAQQPAPSLVMGHEKPLPDIGPMMQKVIANERDSEAKQSDYLVREWLSSWNGLGNCWSPRGATTYLAPQCQGGGWRSISGEDRESEVF